MTQPMANARLRPMMAPTFAPVIISAAITRVYAVIAPWIPVTVVPTSFATVAIETFITELSSVMRNCPAASVNSTRLVLVAPADATAPAGVAAAPAFPLDAPTTVRYCTATLVRVDGQAALPPTPVVEPPEQQKAPHQEKERAERA